VCGDGVRTSEGWSKLDGGPMGVGYNPARIPWVLTSAGENYKSIG